MTGQASPARKFLMLQNGDRSMTKRQLLIPVVDGDTNASVYGQASTAAEALAVAETCFADEISHAERYGPIQLANGQTLAEAWIIFVAQP
jgi:hypothetical protein